MLIYRNNNTEPSLNLALEEWVLTKAKQDCFMLWRNSPAVIVGRNQNASEEINQEFVAQHNIPVVRRLSGGGAVYHDLGNINFTFVSLNPEKRYDFRRFAQPIIEVLQKLGVQAEFSGRNDMVIDGKKFSGNAQYVQGSKVLHHGTLLFQSDLTVLQQALNVKPAKYESKGVKSVASRVTNIVPCLPQPLSATEFVEKIFSHIENSFPGATFADLTADDFEAAKHLVKQKYGNWDWNFGKSAAYNFQNELRYAGGTVECRLVVEKGMIQTVQLYGDFFGIKPGEEVARRLVGIRHDWQAISQALNGLDLDEYFSGMSQEELKKVLL